MNSRKINKYKKSKKRMVHYNLLIYGIIIVASIMLGTGIMIFTATDSQLKDYVWDGEIITERLGSTTPYHYILVDDENVKEIFEEVGSGLSIDSMDMLENELEKRAYDRGNVKVEMGKVLFFSQKETFEKSYFNEWSDNTSLHYTVLRRNNGEYYINFEGFQYDDSNEHVIEKRISTSGDGVCFN